VRSVVRRAFVVALASNTALAGLTACNAILGVDDVRVRASGDGSTEGGAAEGGPDRPNPFQTSLGDGHSCARKTEGEVRCWGDDVQGQNGAGASADGGFSTSPRPVASIDDAIHLASGRNHACVVRRAGGVACWGYNFDGQLGNTGAPSQTNTPVAVMGVTRASLVAGGGNFSCAVRANGAVACWGGNGSGQLGNGKQTASPIPVAAGSLSDVTAIAAGQAHACAVKSDGAVWCWGDGRNGQLGSGGSSASPDPVLVDNLPPASQVACGERSTCALTRQGEVYCWGANELGQLGTGATNATPNPAPIVVSNLAEVTAIAGGRNHTCALRSAGGVACWGSGASGQLGDGAARTDAGGAQPSVVAVRGLENAIAVGAGGAHSCAALGDGRIVCWGANDRGALGNGTTNSEVVPSPVIGYP
jgi:alpha-tubulin suppressor-like RCC1 family protein